MIKRGFHPLTPHPAAAGSQRGRGRLDRRRARRGQELPITLDQDGRIADGRLRYLACLRSGTEPVYETLGAHYTDTMILEFIRDRNVCRQHLGPDQRAVILADYERMREQAEAAP